SKTVRSPSRFGMISQARISRCFMPCVEHWGALLFRSPGLGPRDRLGRAAVALSRWPKRPLRNYSTKESTDPTQFATIRNCDCPSASAADLNSLIATLVNDSSATPPTGSPKLAARQMNRRQDVHVLPLPGADRSRYSASVAKIASHCWLFG